MGDNEAKWYSSLDEIGQNIPGWNLNTLIDDIENATSDFIEKETNHKPYFKAELISDLKDEHIDILQGVTGLSDTDRYSYWRTIFVHINLRLAGNDGPNARSFGHDGYGGAFGHADADAQVNRFRSIRNSLFFSTQIIHNYLQNVFI